MGTNRPNLCVIGLQWGDEAKGKLVDLLTSQFDFVVRYQGGANAGHTVVAGDQVYKLHLIPSGILNPSVTNVIAPGVVLDPQVLLKELSGLKGRGIDPTPRLRISERAHIVFPWHVEEDRIGNIADGGVESIGTTLRGIGPCYRDKAGRSHAIRLGDLIRPGLEQRVAQVWQYKRRFFNEFAETPVALDPTAIAEQYRDYGRQLESMICDTNTLLLDAVEQGKSVLFEGAQGALLDIDHGTFPYVTSSNSSGVGICAGSGLPPRWVDDVIGVCKCYSTRVGGGPFPTELDDATGEHIRQVGKEFGTTTGRPRRCGWFDAVAVRYTVRLSGVDRLALMMLDVLSDLDEIRVCTGYDIEGNVTNDFPAHVEDLRKAKPVYETLPGWKTDVTGARDFADLPANAVRYIRRICELVGRPAEFVSVGPDRVQTIHCPGEIPVVPQSAI